MLTSLNIKKKGGKWIWKLNMDKFSIEEDAKTFEQALDKALTFREQYNKRQQDAARRKRESQL